MNRNKILWLVIVFLVATNLSTILIIYYHFQNDEWQTTSSKIKTDISYMPRGQFFRSELGLDQETTYFFRDLYHQYKSDASLVSLKMDSLRQVMIQQLNESRPDTIALSEISTQIGLLHKELKDLTINYFLAMKEKCNPEQEQKLNAIFQSLLNDQGNIQMPKSHRMKGQGKMRKQYNNNF